mmetsp:Transcript_7241/g.20524  ORF Transcript_7241/g.20524 Transcript_7241/m.20524 type:complete len:397 (+) Transcript_7241:104-1294(+)
MYSVFFLLSLLVIGGVTVQASGRANLTGTYVLDCVGTFGLPPSWRATEIIVVADDTGFWETSAIAFSDTTCLQPAFRYDTRSRYTVLNEVEEPEWTGPSYQRNTYKTVWYFERKEISVLDEEGEAFLQSLCPRSESGLDFPVGSSQDMTGVSCLSLFGDCDNLGHYGCVHVGSDGALWQCASASQACSESEVQYAFAIDQTGFPLQAPPVILEPQRSDIIGRYVWNGNLSRSPAVYVDEEIEFFPNTVRARQIAYRGEDRLFTYAYTRAWQLGFERPPPAGARGQRVRELSTRYLTKDLYGVTETGAEFLKTVCQENRWTATQYRNIIDLDCAPLWYGCRTWRNEEELLLGVRLDGSVGISYPTVLSGSCTTLTRGYEIPYYYHHGNKESPPYNRS